MKNVFLKKVVGLDQARIANICMGLLLELLLGATSLSVNARPFNELYEQENNPFDESYIYAGIYTEHTDSRLEFATYEGHDEGDDNTYSAIVGLGFNKYVSVEVGYIDFGTLGLSEIKSDAYSFGVVTKWPILDRFFPYLKVGYSSWDSKDNDGTKIGGTDFMGGVGLTLKIIDNLALDIRYEKYRLDINNDNVEANVDAEITVKSTAVGINYIF